jgi:Flp pilus assembly protein TadG
MSLIAIARTRRHHLLRAQIRRFVRRKDGATAVEFALVAAPFMALLFAILQTGLVFFANQTLETAVADASRLILTGQAQMQSFDQAAFKQAVCSRIYAMFDCESGLYVDVRTYANFASANTSEPIDSGGNLTKDFTYNPGGPGDIVVVRAMYEWPIYVSALPGNNLGLTNMAGGQRLLMATAAFRNEPYQ